ncbi:MAG: HAD family hydrolase [Candidatus Cloacimonetes bacterium]|nr:HAD family hydrolase [Candidatus Cloacimonadota bacterium]
MKPAVFIDRDGNLNPDTKGFISQPQDFELFSFSAQAIKIFHEIGMLVIVVSNQSGIARGLITEQQLEDVHDKMREALEQKSTYVDAIYVCPFHVDGIIPEFSKEHPDRKPGTGMFEKAIKDFDIEISASYMIGDRYSDILFAHNCNIRSILVLTGDGENNFLNNRIKWKIQPDFICDNILSAAELIKFQKSSRKN